MAVVECASSTMFGNVPQQLGNVLRGLRGEGLDFEEAWGRAWDCLAWPMSKRDQVEWSKALVATKSAWRAAFYGWERLAAEEAVVVLRDGPSREIF